LRTVGEHSTTRPPPLNR